MSHIIVMKNNKYLMFDESDDNYVNTFKIKISFKDLEGKSHKKITNIYNKENILDKTWRDLIRIIPIKDNNKFKSNKLELGVITINLSNIRSTDGTQFATYINSSYVISFFANKVITAIFKFIFTFLIFKFYQIE